MPTWTPTPPPGLETENEGQTEENILKQYAKDIVSYARSSAGTLYIQKKNGTVWKVFREPLTGALTGLFPVEGQSSAEAAAISEDNLADILSGTTGKVAAERARQERLRQQTGQTQYEMAVGANWATGITERRQNELWQAERAWQARKEMEILKTQPISWIEYETRKRKAEYEPWEGTSPPYGQTLPTAQPLPDVPAWLETITGKMPQVPTSWQFPSRLSGGEWSDRGGGYTKIGEQLYSTAGLGGPMRSELTPKVTPPASYEALAKLLPSQREMLAGYLNWSRAQQESKGEPLGPTWEDWLAQSQAGWVKESPGSFPKGKKRPARQY